MAIGNKESETGIGVKKPFVKEMLSKEAFEQRIKDIAHAKRDIVWWAEKFFKIVTLDKGLTNIKLYDKQKELLQYMVDNTRVITLASRQTGKCVFKDTLVKIKNKQTGEIQEIKIIDFFNLIANQSK